MGARVRVRGGGEGLRAQGEGSGWGRAWSRGVGVHAARHHSSNFLPPTPYFLRPTPYVRLPTSHFRLPTSHFLLPTSLTHSLTYSPTGRLCAENSPMASPKVSPLERAWSIASHVRMKAHLRCSLRVWAAGGCYEQVDVISRWMSSARGCYQQVDVMSRWSNQVINSNPHMTRFA